jgi:hypothetical protein
MNIKKIHLRSLRNDEHFQFQTEFRDLIIAATPAALNIGQQYNVWLPLFEQEDDVLKKIVKSAITEDIQTADKHRDRIFRGMVDANKSALNHFQPAVHAAAKRLKVLFDTYGNVAAKPLNEETSAIYNLLQELNGNFAADVATLNITDWVAELESANNAFDTLVKARYDEAAHRTLLVLREVRTQVDTASRAITDRIDALFLLEGKALYEDFIHQLNIVIEKYKNALAHHHTGKKPPQPPAGGL